jgi:hypothetical protein
MFYVDGPAAEVASAISGGSNNSHNLAGAKVEQWPAAEASFNLTRFKFVFKSRASG